MCMGHRGLSGPPGCARQRPCSQLIISKTLPSETTNDQEEGRDGVHQTRFMLSEQKTTAS